MLLRTFFLSIALIVADLGLSQNFESTIFFEDAAGNRDTIIFGLHNLATDSIDPHLGESNIIDLPLKSGLDVSFSNGLIYAYRGMEPTLRSKKQLISEYRHVADVDIKTENYPVIMRWNPVDFLNYEYSVFTGVNPGGWWDVGYTPSDVYRILMTEKGVDTIKKSNVEIKSGKINRHYGYYNGVDSISTFWLTLFGDFRSSVDGEKFEDEVSFYPNPARDFVHAKNFEFDEYVIYHQSGGFHSCMTSESIIYTGDLKPGLYIIELRNENFRKLGRLIKL